MTVGATTTGRDDWSGRLLDGRYRVERVLGSGGMGTVYLAQDEKMQRPVVVKVPHPKMLADEGFRARFDREIRSLTRLSHRSVVKVLDAGSIEAPGAAEPVPYAVLEFLAGGSLADRMASEGGQQSVEEVLFWLPSIAEALDFIHKQGVVHRDVKPSNVLFDQEGHVYLADFGIAKALGSPDTGLTQTGATPGSPNYMAPDVMLSKAPLGPAYDQYSLAVVVYEALSGVLPHVDESPLRLIHLKASVAPRSLHEAAPHVPAAVAAVVNRALSIDAADRFATCGGFAEALRAATVGPQRLPSPPKFEVGGGAASFSLPSVAETAKRAPVPVAAPKTANTPERLARSTEAVSSRWTTPNWLLAATVACCAIMGFIAHRESPKHPERVGIGMAVASVVLGALSSRRAGFGLRTSPAVYFRRVDRRIAFLVLMLGAMEALAIIGTARVVYSMGVLNPAELLVVWISTSDALLIGLLVRQLANSGSEFTRAASRLLFLVLPFLAYVGERALHALYVPFWISSTAIAEYGWVSYWAALVGVLIACPILSRAIARATRPF